mmetsp:Transcript_18180/g.36390  ORF Transcript_18180/g.36390 Transcript_18180/m.36390 type:complete len:494 (-) Transcript_18180:237-1718(-)
MFERGGERGRRGQEDRGTGRRTRRGGRRRSRSRRRRRSPGQTSQDGARLGRGGRPARGRRRHDRHVEVAFQTPQGANQTAQEIGRATPRVPLSRSISMERAPKGEFAQERRRRRRALSGQRRRRCRRGGGGAEGGIRRQRGEGRAGRRVRRREGGRPRVPGEMSRADLLRRRRRHRGKRRRQCVVVRGGGHGKRRGHDPLAFPSLGARRAGPAGGAEFRFVSGGVRGDSSVVRRPGREDDRRDSKWKDRLGQISIGRRRAGRAGDGVRTDSTGKREGGRLYGGGAASGWIDLRGGNRRRNDIHLGFENQGVGGHVGERRPTIHRLHSLLRKRISRCHLLVGAFHRHSNLGFEEIAIHCHDSSQWFGWKWGWGWERGWTKWGRCQWEHSRRHRTHILRGVRSVRSISGVFGRRGHQSLHGQKCRGCGVCFDSFQDEGKKVQEEGRGGSLPRRCRLGGCGDRGGGREGLVRFRLRWGEAASYLGGVSNRVRGCVE